MKDRKLTVINIDNEDREKAEKALLARIAQAELRIQNGEEYMSLDELRAKTLSDNVNKEN